MAIGDMARRLCGEIAKGYEGDYREFLEREFLWGGWAVVMRRAAIIDSEMFSRDIGSLLKLSILLALGKLREYDDIVERQRDGEISIEEAKSRIYDLFAALRERISQ